MKTSFLAVRKTTVALLLTVTASSMAQAAIVYDGSPYTAWASDYTGTEAHTLGLWKFNNPDPSVSSGGASNTISFAGNGVQTGVAGKFGQAFYSGTRSTASDSYAQVSSSGGIFNTTSLSMEFWYSPVSDNPTGTASYSWFFDKSNGDSGVQLRLSNINGGSNRLLFSVGNGTTTESVQTADLTWTEGAWYHIAVTYEAIQVFEGDTLVRTDGLLKIFRDGVQVNTGTGIKTGFGNLDFGTRSWRLGNRATSSYGSVPGYYDNFRISDVAYNYSPIPEPGTVGLIGVMLPVALGIRRIASRRN